MCISPDRWAWRIEVTAMRWKTAVLCGAALVCAAPLLAAPRKAVSTPPSHAASQQPSRGPGQPLTPEEFAALPPTAMINVDGTLLSKEEFLNRRYHELEEALRQEPEMQRLLAAQFAQRRDAFLAQQRASLDSANAPVQAEVSRLVAVDAGTHGPDWEQRRVQAAALLRQAAAADPQRRSELEKQAADLLEPAPMPAQ